MYKYVYVACTSVGFSDERCIPYFFFNYKLRRILRMAISGQYRCEVFFKLNFSLGLLCDRNAGSTRSWKCTVTMHYRIRAI